MKAIIKVKKEVDFKFVKVNVAVKYGEEDIPNDFPFRKGDMWSAMIDLDAKKVVDWPQGQKGNLSMKVTDCGSYYLIDSEGNTVFSIEQDYVPNSLLPGKYGDYIDLQINEEGVITNWLKNANISDFTDDYE